MDRMDQGFRDLLAEVGRLVGEAVSKRMESEEFHESLDEINRRMSDQYGRVIGAIGVALSLEFVTVPVPGGEGKGGKERLSLNFRFGSSKLDQKMGEELGLGLNEEEMNELLEQARQERDGGEGMDNAVPADAEDLSQLPEEAEETAETAEPPDPRSVSQIINSIREAARVLNFQQRRFTVLGLQEQLECLGIKLPKIEQLKKDVVWLQVIQDFVFAVRGGGDTILSMSIILSFERALLQLRAKGS